MTIFYDVTRRLLDERLAIVRAGGTPSYTDLRHFFYECRNKFLRENKQFTKPDSTAKNVYSDWESVIIANWCKKHCAEFNIDKDKIWRMREKLNIWAKGKATCEGEIEKFLIDKDTRDRVTESCSFVLLCEKETVSHELMNRLQGEGYRLNIVATGGYSPSDVQEAVLQVAEELDENEPTFYFLMLHDYDLAGLEIFFNLKKRCANIIDIGINREFFQYLKGGVDARLVEEQVKNKKFQNQLKGYIANSDTYTDEDFEYLQGIQISRKIWEGKRIEIDAIHVEYGIKPFVKYVLAKIQKECKFWDLSRIDVEEFELTEPRNPFDSALSKFESTIGRDTTTIKEKIDRPLTLVNDIVRRTTDKFTDQFKILLTKYHINHFGYYVSHVDSQEIRELKAEYKGGFDREYAPDFEDELDEINDQIKRYEGDVRKGERDLNIQFETLQEQVDEAPYEDEEATEFEDALDQIDWGKKEFEALEEPDEKDVIDAVIEALQKRKKELEDKESGN
jgi:hypothetical protein